MINSAGLIDLQQVIKDDKDEFLLGKLLDVFICLVSLSCHDFCNILCSLAERHV